MDTLKSIACIQEVLAKRIEQSRQKKEYAVQCHAYGVAYEHQIRGFALIGFSEWLEWFKIMVMKGEAENVHDGVWQNPDWKG